jgi:hypothetical protein
MSSSTASPHNPMVAKLLDRARSINIRPDPEDAPQRPTAAPAPVAREVAPAAAEPVAVEEATTQREPVRAKRKPEATAFRSGEKGRKINRSFDIVTGPSTRALTVRIPDDVHARLVLIATSNRLARTGEASTLNELIAEGIEHVLVRYDAA